MSRLKKIQKRFLKPLFFILLFLFIAFELFFRFYGLPSSIHRLLEDSINKQQVDCRFSLIKASLFSGLTFQGVKLTADSSAGAIFVNAREASLSINPWQLLRGKLIFESCSIVSAELGLINENGTKVLDCQKLSFYSQILEKNKLNGRIFFSQNGIRVRGEANIENFQLFIPKTKELLANKPQADSDNVQAKKILDLIAKRLQSCEFGENDTLLNFSIKGDLQEWDSFRVTGDFDLNYVQLGTLMINKQRGRFAYHDKLFQFNNMQWLISSDEFINADIKVNFAEKNSKINLSGHLKPQTCTDMISSGEKVIPDYLYFPNGVSFQGETFIKNWNLDMSGAILHCELKNFAVFDNHFQQGSFTVNANKKLLSFENIKLNMDYKQQKGFYGNISYERQNKKLTGNIIGKINLKEVLKQYNLSNDIPYYEQFALENVIVEVNFDETELELDKLQIQGIIQEQDAKKFLATYKDMKLPFSIKNEKLFIENASCIITQLNDSKFSLNAEIDLQKLLKEEKLIAKLEQALVTNCSEEKSIFTTDAQVIFNMQKHSIEVKQGKLKLIPNMFFQCTERILPKTSDNYTELISSDKEILVDFNVAEFHLTKNSAWQAMLNIEAEKVKFNTMFIDKVQASAEINANQAIFKNINATVNDDDRMFLEKVRVNYNPLAIIVKNAYVEGEPNFFENFIFDDEGIDIYRMVWEDVHWDKEHKPKIKVPELHYWETHSSAKNWHLFLEASLDIEEVYYKDFHIPEAEVSITLELPDELELPKITLKTPKGDINAKAAFNFTGIPYCSFLVNETEAPIDFIQLLKSFNKDWEGILDQLKIDEETKLQCNGIFKFDDQADIQINGNMLSKELQFRNLTIKNANCNWSLNAERIFWKISEAEFLDADIKTSGYYDLQTSSGQSLFSVKNLPLKKAEELVLNDEKAKNKNELKGSISVDCKIEFFKDWAAHPTYLEGNGHLKLRDADLWQVPLMSNLVTVLTLGSANIFAKDKVSNLGNISKLDADFVLQGTRILVNEFKTDGTIIALTGKGEYDWSKDRLNFLAKGQALKSVNLLAFMLKPLSWAFDAELTGSIKKPEWKIRSALNKMFDSN